MMIIVAALGLIGGFFLTYSLMEHPDFWNGQLTDPIKKQEEEDV